MGKQAPCPAAHWEDKWEAENHCPAKAVSGLGGGCFAEELEQMGADFANFDMFQIVPSVQTQQNLEVQSKS